MNMGTPLTFDLPQGWTLRKVATALAREWLPPFRSVPAVKGPPWMVQPIMEESVHAGGPLWEPGISTEEYEERLDQAGLSWSIRAKSGRSKGTILARLAISESRPETFEMVCCQDSFPDTLFDADKLAHFLETSRRAGADGLFAGLLLKNGFQLART